jgi:hypothetical protein
VFVVCCVGSGLCERPITRPEDSCRVWCVCVGFVMCGFFDNMYTEVFLTLTDVFPCFLLSCKANARVKLAKTGQGPYSSKLVVNFVVLCIVCV